MLSLILGISILTSSAVAQCPRSVLQQAADSYLASVKGGKLNLAVADNFEYTENYKKASLDTGFHSNKVNVSLHRHLLDTTACATFTELIAPDNAPPYVVGTQIHYTTGGKASKIETLITTSKNGWLFDAKETLKWASQEKRDIIPEANRDTRAVIQSAADLYLDKFSDSSVNIPRHDPCERLEGKMHVAPNCVAGISSSQSMKMTNRRYVIDETVGTVDVFLNFANVPDSHEFRVEGGKLKYVHTITAGDLSDFAPPGFASPKGGFRR